LPKVKNTTETKNEQNRRSLQLSPGSGLLLVRLLVELVQEGTVSLDDRRTLELETREDYVSNVL
jgi:hypothetical protein